MYSQNVIKKLISNENDVEFNDQRRFSLHEELLITLHILYGDDFAEKIKNKTIKIPFCPSSLCVEYEDYLASIYNNTFIKNTILEYKTNEMEDFLKNTNEKQVVDTTKSLLKTTANGSIITKIAALYMGSKIINTETKFYNESASKAFGFDFNVDDYMKKPVFKYKPNKTPSGYNNFYSTAEEWAEYNVSLIKNIKKQTAEGIKDIVVKSYNEGARSSELIDEILEATEMSKNRVKRIARDQVSKLYGQRNKAQSLAIGLNKYKWRTCLDERVRDSHKAKEGRVYLFDEGINPGEEVNCRCSAETLIKF